MPLVRPERARMQVAVRTAESNASGAYGRSQVFDCLGKRYSSRFLVASFLVFDIAVFQSAFAYDYTSRNSDELHIGEHDTGPLITVVKENFHTLSGELIVQRFCGFANARTLDHSDR